MNDICGIKLDTDGSNCHHERLVMLHTYKKQTIHPVVTGSAFIKKGLKKAVKEQHSQNAVGLNLTVTVQKLRIITLHPVWPVVQSVCSCVTQLTQSWSQCTALWVPSTRLMFTQTWPLWRNTTPPPPLFITAEQKHRSGSYEADRCPDEGKYCHCRNYWKLDEEWGLWEWSQLVLHITICLQVYSTLGLKDVHWKLQSRVSSCSFTAFFKSFLVPLPIRFCFCLYLFVWNLVDIRIRGLLFHFL